MILDDIERRWIELKLYYLMMDIYKEKKNMQNIMLFIEAVSYLCDVKDKEMKIIAGKILSDPYFMPSENEFIYQANLHEIPIKQIAEYLGKSSSNICNKVKREKERKQYFPRPILEVSEDYIIQEFLRGWETLRKAGLQ